MTPSPEAEKAAKEELLPCPFCAEVVKTHNEDYVLHGSVCGSECPIGGVPLERRNWNRRALLSAERAKTEAEFQARLGPWVTAVYTLRKFAGVSAKEGRQPLIDLCAKVDALLSSPDAITAQAREAEIRAKALEEAQGVAKKERDQMREHLVAWNSCDDIATELRIRAAAERAKAKTADKPKEAP